MRAVAMVLLTVLPLVGCSHGPTQPTTSAAVVATSTLGPLPSVTTIWRAQSTVVGVSPTLNSCSTDNVVGQTRSVDWALQDFGPQRGLISIVLYEYADVYDPQHPPNYMSDPRTPAYAGSRTGDQFAATAGQDPVNDTTTGMPTCFVYHGDLTGAFSPDGLSFDAVENIKYTHHGENDMVVSRHWTATRR
jgi:hypothetical protein